MENNSRYIEACAAGERTGLYYTCINSFLTAEEVAYILNNSESRVLITSREKLEVALEARSMCPAIELMLVVDGMGTTDPPRCRQECRLRSHGRKSANHSDCE